jgi:hypothetical protein
VLGDVLHRSEEYRHKEGYAKGSDGILAFLGEWAAGEVGEEGEEGKEGERYEVSEGEEDEGDSEDADFDEEHQLMAEEEAEYEEAREDDDVGEYGEGGIEMLWHHLTAVEARDTAASGPGIGEGGVAGALNEASATKLLKYLMHADVRAYGAASIVFLDIGSGDGVMLELALR